MSFFVIGKKLRFHLPPQEEGLASAKFEDYLYFGDFV